MGAPFLFDGLGDGMAMALMGLYDLELRMGSACYLSFAVWRRMSKAMGSRAGLRLRMDS